MICWHYTTGTNFQKIAQTGLLKSRSLLVSEELRARPDYESIKARINADPQNAEQVLREALPEHTFIDHQFQLKPIIWFSGEQFWETQAEVLHEHKEIPDWEDRIDDSGIARAGILDLYRGGNGLFRIGMSEHKLLRESKVLLAAGMKMWMYVLSRMLAPNYCETYGIIRDALPLTEVDAVEQAVMKEPSQLTWIPVAA